MNSMAISIMKIKQVVTTRYRQAGVWAVSVVLLLSSLALAQTSSVSQQPRKPAAGTESATPSGTAEIASRPLYVDGASSCLLEVGLQDCSGILGPFRKVGGGVRGVSPGGMLFIKRGFYSEPIVLNKKMEIRAYDGTVTIGPQSLAPFDLVADTVDDNGLPLNPKWGAQRKNPNVLPDPGGPLRTNQYTYEDNYGGHNPILCGGPFATGNHVNWFGATYEGIVKWDEHDCPSSSCGDDDYNILLGTCDKAGYTANNPLNIKCEFNAGETILSFKTDWWSRFRKAVNDDGCNSLVPAPICNTRNGNRAGRMIDGKYAIVTGLVGLDCVHGCKSELHPVWAMAMNVQPSANDDIWAFFVRNWGNEGQCSQNQHFIDFPNNKYTFRLPWRKGATSVNVTKFDVKSFDIKNHSKTVTLVPGVGVFLTFTLDAPRENGSMWEGELHLEWIGAGISLDPPVKCPEHPPSP